MSGKYDDIMNLPHHTSPRHPRMSVRDRAAQFAPFSALTGYGDAIDETVRLTDGRVELSEDAKAILDLKQRLLMERIDSRPEVTVTYFEPDKRKTGGSYKTVTARLKRIDETERVLIFTDGTRIKTETVVAISD
ncbi:MAG: hypothetical protein IKC59_08165 [Clostridia bacterium]|nr:hypothetical protein [Clostridia bacterium]